MTTETKELKECPFCRGEAKQMWHPIEPDFEESVGTVECQECGIGKDTAENWNARAPSTDEALLHQALAALRSNRKFLDYDGGCDCGSNEHCKYCTLANAADSRTEKAITALEARLGKGAR